MKNNKKCLSVLSTAAMGTLIATALASGVSAKTTDVVVKMAGQNVKFNFDQLNKSYEDKSLGLEASLYDTFAKNEGIISLLDDKAGYVDYKAVSKANEDAVIAGKDFGLDTFTEAAKGEQILPEVKVDAEWKDGKIVPTTPVQQGISLKIDIADNDSVLKADGADNTMVTVTVLKDGVKDESFKGTVKFQSLKGARFAKETVAFDKGIAKVQLTSISSITPIMDIIRVTISDAEDINVVGKAVETTIKYDPEGGITESGSQVFITYAEASQASDIYVKFNKDIDFDKLYADFIANQDVITVKDSKRTVNPTDIVKVNANTVKLVLNEAVAVNDNDNITVTGKNTDKMKGALLNGGISFNLVDPKAPEAVKAYATAYRTVLVEFTEPVSGITATVPGNWVLNGKVLTAEDVTVEVGNNGVVYKGVKDLVDSKDMVADNRSFVTLTLTEKGAAKLKASGNENLLQAYNMIDYAGITDISGQNKATTQEFRFKTPAAPNAPVVSAVTMDSPEQFRVKFDMPLKTALTAADFGFKYQTDINADGTIAWGGTVELEDARATVTKATVTNIGGADNNEYLIELNQDWTVKLNTNGTGINYYAPKHNNVQITVKKDNVKNVSDVVMAENKVQVLTMALDAKSPEIAKATQVLAADVDKTPLQEVEVTMNKPVQVPSTKELTPSEKQTSGTGIPTPTFQFVNEDKSKTIDGELKGTIDDQDMIFTVKPVAGKSLDAGKWTLYIRSISDDIGNTSATTSSQVEIQAPRGEEVARPIIIWSDAHDNVAGAEDVVHIQFAKEMSLDALNSTMYTINGKILPQGVSITSDERYYDMNNDGKIDANDTRKGTLITITMPKDFLGRIDETPLDNITVSNVGQNMLNVSKSLKDAEGNNIQTPTEVKLTHGAPFVHEAPVAEVVDSFRSLASGYAKLDFTAASTITATITDDAKLLKDAVKVEDLVKAAKTLNLTKVNIGGTEFNLASTPAQVQAAIATLAGKPSFDQVTLADLKGKNITATIDGVVTTLEAK